MRYVLLLLVLTFTAGAFAGDGMPGPWPFPWAKDCPVKWESLEGRYVLPESQQNALLDLKVTFLENPNSKMVRVSRFNKTGELEAEGYSWVAANQKIIRLWLFPMRSGDEPTLAVLKLYFASADRSCQDDHLVAILTLDKRDSVSRRQTQYRLIRIEERKK